MNARKWTWIALIFASLALVAGSWAKLLPLSLTEVFGFITGAVCVLLVVEQNIWNFPVGLANNVFFIALFLTSRLYGDMVLQFVYIGLGIHGWYTWLLGGASRDDLPVSRTPVRSWVTLAGVGVLATVVIRIYLAHIGDSAPLLDAVTTVLSLEAQYLLNCKRLENWYVWIAADIIYVGLYASKGLYLTSVLYAIFIVMCSAGLLSWLRSLNSAVPDSISSPAVVEEPVR